ncbi:hypothetical protein HOP50_09g56740 [Chloropicon primus]|nr:hypothetical protein HOP50_09g56740 [Chloropicon primus]
MEGVGARGGRVGGTTAGVASALEAAADSCAGSRPNEGHGPGKQTRLEEVVARAIRGTMDALEEERTDAEILVREIEESLRSLDTVGENANLWVSTPIRSCMNKLSLLDTHNLDQQQRATLNLLAACHRNLKEVWNDLRECVILEKRAGKATESMRRIMDVQEEGSYRSRAVRLCPEESEGDSGPPPSRQGLSQADSLRLSVCSDEADDLRQRSILLKAYVRLMRAPASPNLVKALKQCFADGRGCYSEFDTLAHGWLEEWTHLTTIMEAVFRAYFSIATQNPGLLLECMKVVEVHENVAADYHRACQRIEKSGVLASKEEKDAVLLHSMMPVLLEAGHASRSTPRPAAGKSPNQVHDNLVDLFVKTVSSSIKKRVVEVARQAFYEETSGDTRSLVLDALVEDLYTHHEDINVLCPERFNMAMTVCTMYSEHLASCLRDLLREIQGSRGQSGAGGAGQDISFSNADILSLITWIERFISATLKISLTKRRSFKTEQDLQSGQVSDTLNGELLSQLDIFRKLYVRRACAKLREWMQGILSKETLCLKELTPEQAEKMSTPLISAGPIDVFSAVQSELHTMLEEVSDPTLAAWSASSIAELILEHSEDFENVVEDIEYDEQRYKGGSDSLERSNSSPAVFAKSIPPFLGRLAVAEPHHQTLETNQVTVEQYCIVANSCAVYHKEASEVVRLVEAKLGVWDLSSTSSATSIVLRDAQRSVKRFENLMKSSIVRFQRSSNLSINFLVKLVLQDIDQTLLDLFGESWLAEGNRCIETCCATFHDYCIDIAEYLQPGVYTEFLRALFDRFVNYYLSGLYSCYSDGRVEANWKKPVKRDVKIATECASVLVSLGGSGLCDTSIVSKGIKDGLKTIVGELAKMIKT